MSSLTVMKAKYKAVIRPVNFTDKKHAVRHKNVLARIRNVCDWAFRNWDVAIH